MFATKVLLFLHISVSTTVSPFYISSPSTAKPTSNYATKPTQSDDNEQQHTTSTRPSLFPYQEDGVKRLVSDRRLLLADDMGLGKTAQSIVALNHLFINDEISPTDCRILIICPKSVVSVWYDELEKWLDTTYLNIYDNVYIISAATKSDPLDINSSRKMIQIINYDICNKHKAALQEGRFDVLICDEAHYLKSSSSQRSNAILGIKEGSIGGIQSRYLWFLTGTPILNRPNEIFPLLWALRKNEYSTPYYVFAKSWSSSFNEVSNLGQLKKLMKPLMLRRKKLDVLKDLPPKLYSVVTLEGSEEATAKEEEYAFDTYGVDLSAARRRSSSDSEESLGEFGEGATLLRYGIGKDMTGREALRALASIRSYTSYLKLEPAVQLLKQYVLCEKVVVFANHRKVILGLVEEFGSSCVHIIGGMDSQARAEAVQRFQHDTSCRLFIGSIRAAGVGLTLTASSHVVFLELDWSPGVMTQAEDRCHRVGQQDSVQVDYFVFKGTIDGWMAQQLARKSAGIRRTLAPSRSSGEERQHKYKLDFGKYRGEALDDIPIEYITKFLVKEEVYKKKPALWNALYLNDVVDEAPLTNPELLEDDDKDKEAANGVLYTFDFGQYYGMEWSQVPQNYRDWVISKGVWQKRIGLWIALHEAGLVSDDPSSSLDNPDMSNKQPKADQSISDDKKEPVNYTFNFGKFNGVKWNDTDQGYRDWIVKTTDIWKKRTDLWTALYEAGVIKEEPESK